MRTRTDSGSGPLHGGARFTKHALERAQTRGIRPDDIEMAIRYGQECRERGATIYYLGERHIPRELLRDARIRRMIGTTVVTSNHNGAIITVYRNRNGLH